jgi:NADH-quinone oxidoreductase subunit H
MTYEWAWFTATSPASADRAAADARGAMIIYVDRKIWAAMALRRGPERGRAVRACCRASPTAQGVPAGNHRPLGGEQGIFLIAPDRHLSPSR